MSSTEAYWRNRPVMYRLFDRDGRLIYIGASANLAARMGQHRDEAWWHQLVTKVRIQVFPTKAAAFAAEAVAIQEEQPAFNSKHTGRPLQDFSHWTADDFNACKAWQEKRGRRDFLPQTSKPRLVWSA